LPDTRGRRKFSDDAIRDPDYPYQGIGVRMVIAVTCSSLHLSELRLCLMSIPLFMLGEPAIAAGWLSFITANIEPNWGTAVSFLCARCAC
jgi:hypothetical protein